MHRKGGRTPLGSAPIRWASSILCALWLLRPGAAQAQRPIEHKDPGRGASFMAGFRFNGIGAATNGYYWFDYLPLSFVEVGLLFNGESVRFILAGNAGLGISGSGGGHIALQYRFSGGAALGGAFGYQRLFMNEYPSTSQLILWAPLTIPIGDRTDVGFWPNYSVVLEDTTVPNGGFIHGFGVDVTLSFRAAP